MAISSIPCNYDEFVRDYYAAIKRQVQITLNPLIEDLEDISQEIVMQFIAGDYLTIYDPEKQSAFAEQRNIANEKKFEAGELKYRATKAKGLFSSFLYEFVKLRLYGIRDKMRRKLIYESQSLDVFVDEGGINDEEQGQTLISFIGKLDTDMFSIELQQILAQIYRRVAETCPPKQNADGSITKDLPQLFFRVCRDSFEGCTCFSCNEIRDDPHADQSLIPKEFDRKHYAAEIGVAVSTVAMQLKDLKLFLKMFKFDQLLKSVSVLDRMYST